MSAEAIVAALLDAVTSPVSLTLSSVSDPPYDGNLWIGPMVETNLGADDIAVAVIAAKGGHAIPYMGKANEDREEYVNVVVRGTQQDYAGTKSLVDACIAACKNKESSTAVTTTYSSDKVWSVDVMEPNAFYAGVDDERRHHFQFTVRLRGAPAL